MKHIGIFLQDFLIFHETHCFFLKIFSSRSSPYFSACEQFCRDWDMTSFDPEYPNMQLDEYDDIKYIDICNEDIRY